VRVGATIGLSSSDNSAFALRGFVDAPTGDDDEGVVTGELGWGAGLAWTRGDSDDAFLAMDRNGNGRIDDGSELFGNHTPVYADRTDLTTANGFEALKFLGSPSYGISVPDGQINARDAAFSRLLLWRDANHNGISEPDELTSAVAAGVVSLSTDYKEKRRVDRFGNEFRQKGTITWADGSVPIYDVWLQWRQ
jgi:hypothetical protein